MHVAKIIPERWANLSRDRAGKRYHPSNGTEGALFIDAMCANCERDRCANGTVNINDADTDDFCPVLMASFLGPVKQWVYGANGYPTCTAFTAKGEAIPTPRCEHTADMFEGAAL